MSFQKRRHRIRLHSPEWIGLALLAVILFAGLATFRQISEGSWIKTTAQVIGVSVPEKSDHRIPESPIAKSQSGLSVLYEFQVNNQSFTGAWKSNWLSTPMVDRVSPEFVSTLRQIDMVRVRNLPSASQNEITLETGLQNSIMSVEAPKSIRGEDFYNISTYRRKSLGGILPMEGTNPWVQKDKLPRINIRYNPKNPNESVLNYPGFNFQYPAIVGFFIAIVVTGLYFSRWYPEIKARRY